MKKLFVGLFSVFFLLIPYAANAAIAFDAASNGNWSTGSSFTFNQTVGSGSNRILWVAVDTGNNNVVSGVTYNGTALTQSGTTQSSGGAGPYFTSLWYLLAPVSGTNAVVVSVSNSPTDGAFATAMSYTGALQSGVPDAVGGAGVPSGTTISASLTTVTANDWVVFSYANNNGSTGSLSNAIQRGAAIYSRSGGDSNSVVASPGSYTITATNGSTASIAMSVAAFAPAPAAPPTPAPAGIQVILKGVQVLLNGVKTIFY